MQSKAAECYNSNVFVTLHYYLSSRSPKTSFKSGSAEVKLVCAECKIRSFMARIMSVTKKEPRD